MALFAHLLLLGGATARHHCTESQTAGAEGAATVLTAQLWKTHTHTPTSIIPVTVHVHVYIYVIILSQSDLTSFLKRLNFDAQQKQRLSIPTRADSWDRLL